MKRWQHLIFFLASLAISGVLYGNTLSGTFVYDDTYILSRVELRDARKLPTLWREPYYPPVGIAIGVYRPLTVFTFALNFLLFGEGSTSFHATNIFLNGAVTYLVFFIIYKLYNDTMLAIVSALLFAFLPIHTEAVANIKSRDDILSSLFALLSWFTFLKAINEHRLQTMWFLTSSILLFLAVMAKEFMVLLPMLLLAVYRAKENARRPAMLKAGFSLFPVTIVYVLIRIQVLGAYAFGRDNAGGLTNILWEGDVWMRIWTAGKILYLYIEKTFIPIRLSATYHYEHVGIVTNPFTSWQTIIGIAFFGIMLLGIFWKKTRPTPLGIGALTFLIPYFMFSKVVFQGGALMGERWMYFPSIGLVLIAAFVFVTVYRKWRTPTAVALVFVLLLYGYRTVSRNTVWLTEEALYKSMVADAPESFHGHFLLSGWYTQQGDFDRAVAETKEVERIYHRFLERRVTY